jgi:hypothetical protein
VNEANIPTHVANAIIGSVRCSIANQEREQWIPPTLAEAVLERVARFEAQRRANPLGGPPPGQWFVWRRGHGTRAVWLSDACAGAEGNVQAQ